MAKTKEELQAEADAEIDALKPQMIQEADAATGETVRREKTEEEYALTKADLGEWKWQQQQFGYISSRRDAYPPLGDQLDMLWHAIDGNKLDKTSDFYKDLKKVKDDNPKPS